MKSVFIFILIFLSIKAFSQETEGAISPLAKNELTVGETSTIEVVLTPMEKRLLSKEALEGKQWLGLFYVAKVNSIKVSENNYDAIVLSLDVIPVKEFRPSELYIWQLGDRNIPIKMPNFKINNVQLNSKEFAIYSMPNVGFEDFDWKAWIILTLTLICLAALFLIFRRKGRRVKDKREDYNKLMATTSTHEDLEILYRKRREILADLREGADSKKFEHFFQSYAFDQFAPNWKERDISELVKAARDLSGELHSGI